MRTDLWDQFGDLLGGSPRLLATVTAHNADGTSTLTTYDGVQMRAFSQLQLAIPYQRVGARRPPTGGRSEPLMELTV